ncbi:MAG: ABC transporter ATP-binding protein [Chloroflexi bacterium]|nr:MAG: ABC transporter ATP-binding protein [Chloroflexota bacterium]
MNPETPVIEVSHLYKTYGTGKQQVDAVRDVSFRVYPGELFGLFGPNGAGKSTIVRILTTLLLPTRGKAWVNGYDVVQDPLAVRASIGLVTADERSFYGRLSVTQNLQFYAAMQNVPRRLIRERIEYVLQLFGLTEKANTPVQMLSSGQKQRLNMARALLHDPQVLFLDEPTRSMDVQTADFVRGLIRDELADKQKKTIVFISHELHEMENFCHRVTILANGRIRTSGTPAELAARLPRRALYRVVITGDIPRIVSAWHTLAGVESVAEVSAGTAASAFDIALADDSSAAWLEVLKVVQAHNGRLETWRRADDESLRRIVAHFSRSDVP